ncbi:MAG: hypothetical protein R2779_10805 [Crocinitomicaceae bacterium]
MSLLFVEWRAFRKPSQIAGSSTATITIPTVTPGTFAYTCKMTSYHRLCATTNRNW